MTVFKKKEQPPESTGCRLSLSGESIAKISQLLERNPLTDDESRANILTTTEREQYTRLPFNFTIGEGHRKQRISVPPKAQNVRSSLKTTRENLPIFSHRKEIVDAINGNSVVVISGETGSGKTTQVPQYIMEEFAEQGKPCRIICTQPRRLAATSIADRVSQERNDKLGRSVGYQIRLDSKVSADTNLIFTTSGYLLRCLMGSNAGEIFNSVTHLLLDEVHEREKITDFLLIAIKDGLSANPNIRVVLMSATLDSEIFSNYFFNCPVINVPGRMFAVDLFYLGQVLTLTGFKTKNMVTYMDKNRGPKILRQDQASTSSNEIPNIDAIDASEVSLATASQSNGK